MERGEVYNSLDEGVREDSPLLHAVADPVDGGTTCDSTIQNPGITLRRCMVLPLFVCYCLAGGVFMYESPQYTQHRMIEKYDEKKTHLNTTASSMIYSNVSLIKDGMHKNNCYINKTDPSYVIFDDVQKDTAMWTMYYTIATYVPALLANLLWASYSDVYGRRFALLICCIGTTLRLGLFAAVIYFELSLIFLVLGAFIDGVCGSFTLLFAALFSYISDITPPGQQRTIAIVTIELILGLSFTVASFCSGFILTSGGYFYPALICFCVMVLGVVILIFLVPETRPQDQIQNHSRNILQIIAESLKFYCFAGPGAKRLKYILLMLSFLCLGIPALGRSTMEMLYQLGRPFCWDSKKIGYFGAIKTVISALTGMMGAYWFRRCMSDDTVAVLSICLTGVSYIVEGLAATDAVLYTVPALALLSSLPIPMIRSLMSCLTPANKQGAMFASIGFVEVLCSLIASVSNTTVYTATLSVMNGFVFLLMALLTFIGAVFLFVFMYVNRKYKTEFETSIVSDEDLQS